MLCKFKNPQGLVLKYLSENKAATAIEYGMIASGVCLVIAGSVFLFGEDLGSMITGLSSALDGNSQN